MSTTDQTELYQAWSTYDRYKLLTETLEYVRKAIDLLVFPPTTDRDIINTLRAADADLAVRRTQILDQMLTPPEPDGK